ncbi:hypothetical protein Tco_1523262 [Tanacetum coccineum]
MENQEQIPLYPEHNNKDYFKFVSDFISKCCLRKPFTRSPDMYKEYLGEFCYSATALENSKVSFSIPNGGIFLEVGVNPFRNAIGAHYLAHSSEYVAPPSIDVVRQCFPTIGYGEDVSPKGTLKKSFLPPRWRLLMAQIIQCLGGKTRRFDQITNKDAIILYSLANGINIDYANIFWEDIILKLKKKQKEKPPVSTLVDPRMHKEDQQATGGSTSLGVTTVSTVEADPGNFAPSDFIPYLFAGTDPHVLAYQTKSVSEGLDTILTQSLIRKGASSIARQPSFKDLDSPKDGLVIIIEESDEEENEEIHATKNVETKDTSVPKSSSPLIQELTNQLKEMLVKFLKIELSNIISTNDFSSSLPIELKDISSKLNELTREVQSLISQVAELKALQWELPQEFLSLPAQVATVQAKLKTLDALLSLLSHVTKALNKFAQVLVSASSKARDKSVPSAGQADTMPAEGEKNTNQATRAEKVNLNKTQPEKTTPPFIPPIITTTTQMQSPFPQRAPKDSSQTEGEHIQKDKGKKAMSSEDAEERVQKVIMMMRQHTCLVLQLNPLRKKEQKKLDFVTEGGEHVHLTKEQISAQKKIEEEAKAEAARRKCEIRKE